MITIPAGASTRLLLLAALLSVSLASCGLVGDDPPHNGIVAAPLSARGTDVDPIDAADPGCRTAGFLSDPIAALQQIRIDDLECGPPSEEDRLCRAFVVLAATDPFVIMVSDLDPERRAALVELHHWALAEGAAVGGDSLSAAFTSMAAAIDGLSFDPDEIRADRAIEAETAAAAIARAVPEIVEPMGAAEASCSGWPGDQPDVVTPADDE